MEQENMGAERADGKEENNSRDVSDWQNRRLCSDESCIGVIGPDGRCKECGKKYEGPLGEGSFGKEESSSEALDLHEGDVVSSEAERNEYPSDSDWQNRRLCSDGNCIGVIGPDGRCKECGKPYEA
jgi:hypothetical protein